MGIFDRFKKETAEDRVARVGTKGRKYVKEVNALGFYTGLLDAYLEQNDTPEEPIGNGYMYYTPDSIFTSQGVKKVFFITSYPEELDRGFMSDLRIQVNEYASNYMIKIGKMATVSVNLIADMEHYDLRLDSLKTRGRWRSFTKLYEKVEREIEEKTLEDELNTDKYSDSVRRKVRSFLHIKQANERNRAAFYTTRIFVEIEVKTPDLILANEILKEAKKGLDRYMLDVGMKTRRLFLKAHNFYKNFSPASRFDKEALIRRVNGGVVYSDDTLSSLFMPEHGKVGDNKGVYFGIDIKSNEVIAFDFAKDGQATNILVTAPTGSGKSMYIKVLLSFTAILPEYQIVIFDYEGTEYAPLGIVTNATTVGMGGTDGSYVNTMVIPEPFGDNEIDEKRLSDAKNMTTRVFDLLCKTEYRNGMSDAQRAVYSYVLDRVYTKAGINPDNPKQWYERSKDLTFYSIFGELSEMRNDHDNDFYTEFNEEDINEFYTAIKVYFGKGEVYNYWFSRPISIVEFLESKDVIYNFGMSDESESSIDPKQLELRQLFASYLTTLKASKNKVKGLRTVVVIDEMQRYMKMTHSGQIIAQFTSGGRKLGLITFLIINAPGELIGAGDVNNPLVETNYSTVLSNLTGYVIGTLRTRDMDMLINEFGLENAANYLYDMARVSDNDLKTDPLKHTFYIHLRGVQTIVKAVVHPALVDSAIYSTTPVANTELRGAESKTEDEVKGELNHIKEEDNKMIGKTYKEKVEKEWK